VYADGRSGAVPVRRLPGGDSSRDGQPDCQRHGDEQGLDVGQHGDLALFPLPPVQFIVAAGGFNGRAFAIQGEERPLGREVTDEGEGSRMAWPPVHDYTGRVPAPLFTHPPGAFGTLATGGDERIEVGAAARGLLITGLALYPDHIVPTACRQEIEPGGCAKARSASQVTGIWGGSRAATVSRSTATRCQKRSSSSG
jgi:hypothetical protein